MVGVISRLINKNLEQQGRSLLEKYLAETSSSTSFGELMSFENGFAFKSETYLSQGRYRIITIKNVHDGKIDAQGATYIDEIPSKMKKRCFLNIGDVLLSLTGNVGRVGIVYETNLLLNQRVAKFNPFIAELLPWLYFAFRLPSTKTTLETISKGTAQQNLSPVETLKQTIPYEEESALELSAILKPIMEQLIANEIESLRLCQIRDTLLPQLMANEIDVSSIDL